MKDITREELFALVWAKPTVEVARDIGVSDVAVAKLCARLQVPKPPRGYWARTEAGQKPQKPALRAFREELEERRKAQLRPQPGVISLTPIQGKFVDKAMEELAKKGADVSSVTIRSNQLRRIPADTATQMLLLIQNSHQAWCRKGEVDVALTRGALRSLAGLVDKVLPLAKPQVLVLERPGRSFLSTGKEPTILIRLTAHLQERIAQLARMVREQRLNFVVMPLEAPTHAWVAYHAYAADSYTKAESALCISATEIWVTCSIILPRWRDEDERETFATERLALRDIMPIDLMPSKEVEIPPRIGRIRIKDHWPRLRALIEAERVCDMLERSTYDIDRSIPDPQLAVADLLWFGGNHPMRNARVAWDRLVEEMERWQLELDAEREDLCRTILGVSPGDIVVRAENGQLMRLSVTRASITVGEDRVYFSLDGLRFRKDGTLGKRAETIWIGFWGGEGRQR